MKTLEVMEKKYQQLNAFYESASLPVKMLFLLGIGAILVGIFAVILPPVYKAGQEFGASLYNRLNH